MNMLDADILSLAIFHEVSYMNFDEFFDLFFQQHRC